MQARSGYFSIVEQICPEWGFLVDKNEKMVLDGISVLFLKPQIRNECIRKRKN